jgi:glycosyltransferase involved in cell wall biosynthesis
VNAELSFDLVLATIGRTQELRRLLDSLVSQTHREFRLILIDQNEDRRLEPILDEYRERIALLRVVSEPGLSRARNVGLGYVERDVVLFPDDDCWYPPNLLRTVSDNLGRRPDLDGVTGRTVDKAAGSPFVLWQRDPGLVTRENVWRTAVAVTIFLRRATVERVGAFDESLGAGSGTTWGSGEETDYLLRALDAGFAIGFDPELHVFHESPKPAFAPGPAEKAYLVGMGNSRVLRKHGYSGWFAFYRVLQLVAASAFFLVTARPGLARFYAAMARGRAVGWISAAGSR